ncbi:hypothetical protein [Bradyrhizobium elkanii]
MEFDDPRAAEIEAARTLGEIVKTLNQTMNARTL